MNLVYCIAVAICGLFLIRYFVVFEDAGLHKVFLLFLFFLMRNNTVI